MLREEVALIMVPSHWPLWGQFHDQQQAIVTTTFYMYNRAKRQEGGAGYKSL